MLIADEAPEHSGAINALLDLSFGSNRTAKTVYRLREGVDPIADLCLVALDGDALAGSIRFWPITIGGPTPALLLGPIAIAADWRGRGVGGLLIRNGLNRAAALGHRIVLLVGDAPYYGRFGFTRALTERLSLPGPVDLDRFLGLELTPGALSGASGMVGRAGGADLPLAGYVPMAMDDNDRLAFG